MDSIPYKEAVIGFSLVVFAFEAYLNYRQHLKLKETERPVGIRSFIRESVFQKTRLYNIDKFHFAIIYSLFSLVQEITILQYDLLPGLWWFSGELIRKYFGFLSTYINSQSLIFLFLLSISEIVVKIPMKLYQTFVIEEEHGFNNSSISLFFIDFLKVTIWNLINNLSATNGFLHVIKMSGSKFPLYLWLFMVLLQLEALIITPMFIQPLFYKFSPLEDGPLKEQVEELAESLDFPLTNIYVIDGSKRTEHSNAYFIGLLKSKRIVLFDTLIKHSTTDEILAILAHELGHWKLNHITSKIVLAQLHLFIKFLFFKQFITNIALYEAFGFTGDKMPVYIGFILFTHLYAPVDTLYSFLVNILSRKHEFQADAFAVQLGRARPLATGLIKLQSNNFGDLNPDPLYSVYRHSHPSLSERLTALPITLTKDDVKSIQEKKED